MEAKVYIHLDQAVTLSTYMNLRTTKVLAITIQIIERIKTGSNSPVLTLMR